MYRCEEITFGIVYLVTGGTAGYQILAPAYYDQNGQLVMSTGRGMGTPVRLVSPAPILVNAGQQGKFILLSQTSHLQAKEEHRITQASLYWRLR